MKKIQVSTVQRTADVEVIFVNSPLVIKFTRAQCALESIKEKIETYCMNTQDMWYEKKANTFVAGRQYEDEKTTWPGHKFISHLPVEYPKDL